MSKDVFVFVVCGDSSHIDTLHLSLLYLKKYSKNEIVVVTDSTRNEIPVNHTHIVDVKVDAKYNHHQASIYLKTGLYKLLPKGNNYCYLDTDVIAVSKSCDDIFNEFKAPIIFAPDHCKVRKFSSYAVNCGCSAKWKENRDKFNLYIKNIENITITDPRLLQKAKELQYVFDGLKESFLKKVITAFRYFLSYPKFKLNNEFYFDRKKRTWHLTSGEIVMYEVDVTKIQKATGLVYNKWNQKWLTKQGDDIWQDECNHLTESIADTFNIDVKDKNWQHWNGGVFLFNDSSADFLESWHKKTLHIFNVPQWKTRDQGTLIATAWQFGLDNHPTLPKRFNFIADYYNNGVQINIKNNTLTDDGFKTSHQPALIHVYHHWQDKTWLIWNWIETR